MSERNPEQRRAEDRIDVQRLATLEAENTAAARRSQEHFEADAKAFTGIEAKLDAFGTKLDAKTDAIVATVNGLIVHVAESKGERRATKAVAGVLVALGVLQVAAHFVAPTLVPAAHASPVASHP